MNPAPTQDLSPLSPLSPPDTTPTPLEQPSFQHNARRSNRKPKDLPTHLRKIKTNRTWVGDEEDEGSDQDLEQTGPLVQTSPLLALPSETLLHIISFLPPSSLLDLSATCKDLNDTISGEAAWRASFEKTFVASGLAGVVRSCLPGGGGQGWRKEALAREKLVDVVANSNAPSVLYDPRLSHIHSFALGYPIPPPKTPSYQYRTPTLICASIGLGVCTRSNPMTGTLVKGYIDSQGSNDHTLWNIPQTRPTALLLSPRDPSTIFWGFQDGQVAQTSIIAGSGRTPTLTARSRGTIGHEGPVWSLVSGPAGSFVSGGQDGRVKLWAEGTGDNLVCLWTSEQPALKNTGGANGVPSRPAPGAGLRAVSHVCWDVNSGVVAGVTEEGEVRVWTGLSVPTDGSSRAVSVLHASSVSSWREEGERLTPGQTPASFALDVVDLSQLDKRALEKQPLVVNVLLRISNQASFRRTSFLFSSPPIHGELGPAPTVTTTRFGSCQQEGSPELTTLFSEFKVPPAPSLPFHSTPSFTPSQPSTPSVPDPSQPQVFHLATSKTFEKRTNSKGCLAGSKFVVAGDSEGVVRIWDWEDGADGEGSYVSPLRTWRGADGKVTALECQQGLVVVGSLEGIVKIWDSLQQPPQLLHQLIECAPGNRRIVHHLQAGAFDPDLFRVSNIVLERDLLVCSIGTKILSWKIGRRIRRDGKSPFTGKIIGRGGNGWEGRLAPGKTGHQSPGDIKDEIANARLEHTQESMNVRQKIERDRSQKERFMGELGLTDEEYVAYAMMLSQEEELANASVEPDNERDGQGEVDGPAEDEDEDLRRALERSLLDEPQWLDDLSGLGEPSTSVDSFPLPRPEEEVRADAPEWPAMVSALPTKGKQPVRSSKDPAAVAWGGRSASSPAHAVSIKPDPPTKMMTREEREAEELRMVLEMSLVDQ